MYHTKQASLFGLICATLIVPPAAAQDLDTSRLPRTGGSAQIYASPATTIFTAKEPVPAAGDIVKGLLAAQGWRQYDAPFSQTTANPAMRIMNLKKGRQALSVFITIAPAQNNATGVTYNALALANDLPFPDDATEILFAPDRPHLDLRTAQSVDATLAFFRKELAARGWSVWSRKEGAKQVGGPDGEKQEKGAYAYYVQENKQPLLLTLQSDSDGTKVELKGVPPSLLVVEKPQDKSQEKPAESAAATRPQERTRTAADDTSDQISKEIERAVRGAISDAFKAPQRPQQQAQPQAPAETLRVMAGSPAPVPVPDAALDLDFNGERGSLDFNSPASVGSLAAFYREQMKSQGWQERSTPINRPNMVTLEFRKQDKQLALTIMQMGPKVNVSGTGSALVVAAAKPAAPERTARLAPPAAPQELDGEEMGGLPVPAKSTSKGTEKTPFRVVLSANVSADVGSVVAFYRRELARKKWTEDTQAASIGADKATLAYTTPEGPAVLKLEGKGDETVVALSLRKPDELTKAGLMPKPGQAMLMLGNMLDKESAVTINKQTTKVGAGVGKTADGPKLALPPGKYKYTVRANGKTFGDEVEIAAGEVWGMIVGPGGALTLQMY